jgi:AcrR family transcriptional regulator
MRTPPPPQPAPPHPPDPPDQADQPGGEADARERLLAAAQGAFAERGFDGATVRDICKAAGANVAAVSYYFGDKERLYIEAVKHAHACTGRMDRLPAFPPGTPPVEKLRAFVREMAANMHAPASPQAMKLMMREMADPGMAAHVVVTEFIQPAAFALRAILRELLPDTDESHLLMTGFSVIGQCLFYRQNRPVAELIFGRSAIDALGADAVADHVVRFTLAALGYADPLGHPASGPDRSHRPPDTGRPPRKKT